MPRRVVALLVALVLAAIGLSASQASAADLFGQPVQVGTTLSDVTVAPGLIRLTDVQVTGQVGSGITASATLYAGASTTPVQVSLQYADASNWSISLQRNGAPPTYVPTSSTSLNINALDGTITDSGGYVSYQLTLHGYVLGDATLDMVARVTSAGFEAGAVVADLAIGGFTLQSASVNVSSVSPAADIRAQLESDAGSFDVDIQATGLTGGGYHLVITADGADLKGGGGRFHMTSFGFSWQADVPATGCASFDVAITGAARVGNNELTLNNGELALSCTKVTKFVFSVTISHKSTTDPQRKTATLTINWFGSMGEYTPTFGPKGEFTMTPIDYLQGFFGTVDLSRTYDFSQSGFKRTVTLGIGFTVAAYTGYTVNNKFKVVDTGPVLSVGAAGYFDANRVSGDITCDFTTNMQTHAKDFDCGGDMRVNPPNAGIWHISMDGF